MMISFADRMRVWLSTGQFPPSFPTSKAVFMAVRFTADALNKALEKVHPLDNTVGVIVAPIVYNNNEKDNAKLALYSAIIDNVPIFSGNPNPQKSGNAIQELKMDQQEVSIGSQFYSNIIDFDFVFFPTSEIQRLLNVKGADGSKVGSLQFTKIYSTFNGLGGKDFLFQNLVVTPYPNGFFEQAKAGKELMGSELTEYSHGFACPPRWDTHQGLTVSIGEAL
jgi:hypothetical protein